MGLAQLSALGHLAGTVLCGTVVRQGAAAAASRRSVEGAGGWARDRARGFCSTAAAMAPIKVTAGPAGPDLSFFPLRRIPLHSWRCTRFSCPRDPSPLPSRTLSKAAPPFLQS